MTVHPSDSAAQRDAEGHVLAALSAQLGVGLAQERIALPGGGAVVVDGVDPDRSVFVEVYSRIGELKAAQKAKTATDILKLITLRRQYSEARLVLAFASEEAARAVRGRTWRAFAVETWGVEVVVVDVPAEVRQRVLDAQAGQVMVNPTGLVPAPATAEVPRPDPTNADLV